MGSLGTIPEGKYLLLKAEKSLGSGGGDEEDENS